MVGVDDQVARAERRQLCEEGVGALAALLAADQPVAEHVLLGQHRHVGAVKPWSSGSTIRRHRSCAERFLPAVG